MINNIPNKFIAVAAVSWSAEVVWGELMTPMLMNFGLPDGYTSLGQQPCRVVFLIHVHVRIVL